MTQGQSNNTRANQTIEDPPIVLNGEYLVEASNDTVQLITGDADTKSEAMELYNNRGIRVMDPAKLKHAKSNTIIIPEHIFPVKSAHHISYQEIYITSRDDVLFLNVAVNKETEGKKDYKLWSVQIEKDTDLIIASEDFPIRISASALVDYSNGVYSKPEHPELTSAGFTSLMISDSYKKDDFLKGETTVPDAFG